MYTGPLDLRTMSKEQKQGYVSWANQCSKCNNQKNPDYKYYGGKGVKVRYSCNFVSLDLAAKFAGISACTVSRLCSGKYISGRKIKTQTDSGFSFEYWGSD